MNRKCFVDIMICCLTAAIMVLCFTYMEEGILRAFEMIACGILILVSAALAVRDARYSRRRKSGRGKTIQQMVLLDEDGNALTSWHIGGKTAVLIGRDTKKENVDINLQNTEYGGMVDRQHAVLNYAGGQWYIEDLGSKNGIRIEKKEEGKLYQVSREHLCRVNTGDILYIGNTRLKAE